MSAILLLPTRLRAAVALMIIAFLTSTTVLGFANASSESTHDPVPATWEVPLPHAGDHLRFWRTLYNVTTGESIAPEQPRIVNGHDQLVLEFKWLDDGVGRDQNGALRLLNRALVEDHFYGAFPTNNGSASADTGNFLDGGNRTNVRSFDPETGTLVSALNEFWKAVTFEGKDQFGRPSSYTKSLVTRSEAYFDPDAAYPARPPCGVRNGFQGASVELTGPVDILPPCSVVGPAMGPDKGPLRLHAVRSETLGTDSVLLMEAAGAKNATFRIWFSTSSPYPVQISRLGALTSTPVETIRIELVERGTKPLASVSSRPTLAPPKIELGPRHQWGPDETGIDHPFPLSVAFEQARSDPDRKQLKDFLERHPDAYVHWARYDESSSDKRSHTERSRSWTFALQGEGEDICVLIVRSYIEPLAQAVASPPRTHYGTCRIGTGSSRGISLADLPREVPTVASVFRAWRALNAPLDPGASPNAWEFEVNCGGNNCSKPAVEVRGGLARRDSNVFHISVDGEYRNQRSLIMANQEGRLMASNEQVWLHEYSGSSPPLDASERKPIGTMGSFETMAPPKLGWKVPSAKEAATAGIGALVLAVLYYVWPLIKSGPLLGLYSRVVGPRVLEHPKRALLLQLIEQNPGIHFLELARRAELGHGGLEHHLAKMRESGLIVRSMTGEHHCYFAKGAVDRNLMAVARTVKSAASRAILQAIRKQPGLRGVDIATQTNLSPPSVNYHLDRFREAGLIDVKRNGTGLSVSLSPMGVKAAELL